MPPPIEKLFIASAASSSTLGSALNAIATGHMPPANESTEHVSALGRER